MSTTVHSFNDFTRTLVKSAVILPGSEDYIQAIARWSEGAEKPAVGVSCCCLLE